MVSIIVPVYNAEKYLRKCLDSILAQTFHDFELILVDDGSSDASGKICDEYSEIDSRTCSYHKENSGVSSTRNFGLSVAKGNWIVFVDSDDVVDTDYIEKLYNSRCMDGVTVAGFYEIENNQVSLSVDFGRGRFSVRDNSLFDVSKNKLLYTHPSPIAKIFDIRIIRSHKIQFLEDVSICEDLLFWTEYILYAKEIKVIPPISYYYLKDNSYLTRKTHSFLECYKLTELFMHLSTSFAKKNGKQLADEAKNHIAVLAMNAIYSLYSGEMNRTERLSSLQMVVCNFGNYISCYYVPQTKFLKISKLILLSSVNLFDLFNIVKNFVRK